MLVETTLSVIVPLPLALPPGADADRSLSVIVTFNVYSVLLRMSPDSALMAISMRPLTVASISTHCDATIVADSPASGCSLPFVS